MKSFKKLLFVIPLLSLFSCGEQPLEVYQLNEEQFNIQRNLDHIILESNFTIEASLEGEFEDVTHYDYGKIAAGRRKLKIELENYLYKFNYYFDDGEVYQIYKSKTETYNYFFGDYAFFFDLSYSDISFNSGTKRYDVDVSKYDESYQLSGASFSVYNGQVLDFSCQVGARKFTAKFTNIGTTKVDLNIESKDYTLVYQVEATNGKDDQYIVSYATECLNQINANVKSVSYEEGTLEIVIHEAINSHKPNYLEYLFLKKVGETAVLTNAHDTIVENLKAEYYPGPDRVSLALTASTESFNPLLEELIEDIQNSDTEYAIAEDSGEGDDEGKVYSYPVFLWKEYDEEICTFDNFIENVPETLELLLTFGKYNLDSLSEEDYIIWEWGGETTLYIDYGYIDYDGNGVLSEQEILKTQRAIMYLACYINLDNQGFNYLQYTY